MPTGPHIQVRDLGKQFGEDIPALEALSFEVGKGEIVSLVGPSGCGKSTLLRLVAGLIRPTAGQVHFDEEPGEVAFIFQDSTLLPWASVLGNISLPMRLRGVPTAERQSRARAWAERLGLGHRLHHYPRQLSGGMRMRVSIARALSLEPGLLLLDEPFAALDAITRNRLNEELLELHRSAPWTALFVTHSVNEAVFMANRILLLKDHPGRIAEVIDNPLPQPRTARLRESMAFQQKVAEVTSHLQEALRHEGVA